MNTRSKTAAQLHYERRYQKALEKYPVETLHAFKRGILAVLQQWTALELAIHHHCGGPDSGEYAEALQDELFALYIEPDPVYRDDVVLVLEDYLEDQLKTICEDGSPDEIGQVLCSMWSECIVGNYNMVNTMIARERARRNANVIQYSQVLAGGDDEDGESDDEEDGARDPNALIQEAMDAMNAGELMTINEGEMEEDAPPLVDEDGFQTVSRKGRKGKGRK